MSILEIEAKKINKLRLEKHGKLAEFVIVRSFAGQSRFINFLKDKGVPLNKDGNCLGLSLMHVDCHNKGLNLIDTLDFTNNITQESIKLFRYAEKQKNGYINIFNKEYKDIEYFYNYIDKTKEDILKKVALYQSYKGEDTFIPYSIELDINKSFEEIIPKALFNNKYLGLIFGGSKSSHIISIIQQKHSFTIFDPNYGEIQGLNSNELVAVLVELNFLYNSMGYINKNYLTDLAHTFSIVADLDHTYNGNPRLFNEIINNKHDIAKFLIESGANVNAVNKSGKTALLLAIEKNKEEITKVLVSAGADINQADKKGVYPLFKAVEKGNKNIVELLVNKGVDVNKTDIFGKTALLKAVEKGSKKIIDLLIDGGADINKSSKEGITPLLRSILDGKKILIELLLKKGANIDMVDNKGNYYLFKAIEKGDKEIIKMVITNANVNIVDKNNVPLLLKMINNNNNELIKLVIENGADISLINQSAWAFLLKSINKDNYDLAKLVLLNSMEKNNSWLTKFLIEKGLDYDLSSKIKSSDISEPLSDTCVAEELIEPIFASEESVC